MRVPVTEKYERNGWPSVERGHKNWDLREIRLYRIIIKK